MLGDDIGKPKVLGLGNDAGYDVGIYRVLYDFCFGVCRIIMGRRGMKKDFIFFLFFYQVN